MVAGRPINSLYHQHYHIDTYKQQAYYFRQYTAFVKTEIFDNHIICMKHKNVAHYTSTPFVVQATVQNIPNVQTMAMKRLLQCSPQKHA